MLNELKINDFEDEMRNNKNNCIESLWIFKIE